MVFLDAPFHISLGVLSAICAILDCQEGFASWSVIGFWKVLELSRLSQVLRYCVDEQVDFILGMRDVALEILSNPGVQVSEGLVP